MASTASETVGDLLKAWRQRRRLSQLDLACDAEISTRHLSFVESGRASASRTMLLRLGERLALSLRERNRLLLAGGYAPSYPERPLEAPDMAAARAAVEAVLAGHEPYPALAVDRRWTLVAANTAASALMSAVAPRLLAPPVNVLRLSLAPDGLAPAIDNLAEWRHHVLTRLKAEVAASHDRVLAALHAELAAIPSPAGRVPPRATGGVAVPLVLRLPGSRQRLSFLSTTTVFGTATDVTLAELTLECFFPADAETRAALARPT